MNVVVAKTKGSRAVNDLFTGAESRLPGSPAIAVARRGAFEAFEQSGLPHRRIEDWKYTDLRAMVGEIHPLAPAPDAAALARVGDATKTLAVTGARRLVLVDGIFVPELSDLAALGPEVSVTTLRDALTSDAGDLLPPASADAMIMLNTALATDGVVLSIADGAQLSAPIQIIHIATAASASIVTRSYLRVGKGARATIVENFAGAGKAAAYQINDFVHLVIGDGADVAHVRLLEDAVDAVNITSGITIVGAHAKLNFFNMATGAAVSRYQANILLAGEGGQVETNGVNLLKGKQHADTTLVMDHAVPHCTSREVFRAVIDDRAHSVFQGRIIVKPGAQKTDAKMMTRALLLSDEAEADNKPELEIFADDVTCGHGATAGALDETLLFYLRARGLSEKEAQALLIQAFVGEAIESIANDDLRDLAIATAERWLESRA